MFRVVFADNGEQAASETFASAIEAIAFRATLASTRATRIARVISDDWRMREAGRLRNGIYTPLPRSITESAWWQGSKPAREHFAHMASDGERIAYTQSPEKGMDDKQNVLSITKYLAKYFGDVLKPHEIAKIADVALGNNLRLVIKNDRESFRFAYIGQEVANESSSFRSCMRLSFSELPCHPAEAYAAGDLAIAYIPDPRDSDKILARAIVWPARKEFVKIYGVDERARNNLENLLDADGYTRADDFEGASLRAITFDSETKIIIPYLDGDAQHAEYDGSRTMEIVRSGNVDGTTTSGYTRIASRFTCDNCQDDADEDDIQDVQGETWCQYCVDNHAFYCNRSDEYYPDSESSEEVIVSSRGRVETWHADAVAEYAFYCDRTEAYFCQNNFTGIEVNTTNGAETWCEEKAEGYFECERSGNYYSSDDFAEIEVIQSSGNSETWCEEESQGEYYTCVATGKAYAGNVELPESVAVVFTCRIDDARQIEIALS
jgi:hypothetical protein